MKFHFIGLFALIMLTANLEAQHVNIGIKGGLNVYTLNNDNDADADFKAGFHAGLLGHIHIKDQFALQPELVFSVQGAGNPNNDSYLNLNYINIPVLFQYMFDNGFRLQAGPQLGLLLSAKLKDGDSTTDRKDNYKSIDLGLGLGASYVHPPTGYGVDVRYNHGLSNINAEGSVNTTNSGIQIGVFYLFGHR